MINPDQLREYVIRPTLKYLDPEIPYSEDAVELLMMTAAHESKLGTYLKQVNGPALGIYQMEPSTATDIWDNFLSARGRKELSLRIQDWVKSVICFFSDGTKVYALTYNLVYATAMARVHYYRVPEALPKKEDIAGMARYAKKYYNTHLGKATILDYSRAYERYC